MTALDALIAWLQDDRAYNGSFDAAKALDDAELAEAPRDARKYWRD